jgi:hypothetical protein
MNASQLEPIHYSTKAIRYNLGHDQIAHVIVAARKSRNIQRKAATENSTTGKNNKLVTTIPIRSNQLFGRSGSGLSA